MNTIISLATDGILEHASVFLDTQRRYAEKMGYHYSLFTNPLWPEMAINNSKVPAIYETMEGMSKDEILIFLDADIGITNETVDLGDVIRSRPKFFLSGYRHFHWKSWPHICDALLIMRVSPELRRFVRKWMDYCTNGCPNIIPERRVKIIDFPYEQMVFDHINREWNFSGIHPAEADEVGCFSTIWNDGCAWAPGMPTVHCGGAQAPWERRAQVFREIYQPQSIC